MENDLFDFAQPEWLGEASSTNDLLKKRIASGEATPSGYVLAARRQTRGRGRMGSEWLSSREGDLTFSFFWKADAAQSARPVVLGALPMACSLGVRDFLERPPRRIAARCKWPNDVLVDDAKICGILTEGGSGPSGDFGLVVGIGVNLRAVSGRDDRFGRSTTAVESHASGTLSPEALLPELLECLEGRIRQWRRSGFAAIRGDMTEALWGMGRAVSAKTAGGKAEGVVAGLGENGELLLRDGTGRIFPVASVSAIEGGW